MDLFAGPGGLGEGFASLLEGGEHPFRIGLSIEKEGSAHRTLTLRAFLREYLRKHGELPEEYVRFHAGLCSEPDWSSIDEDAWSHATSEARCVELGTEEAAEVLDAGINRLASGHNDTILIGGPPCQAYSLVGRSRSRGIPDYRPEEDERHFLFREYIRVLDRLRPAAFVLENVKGVLSSRVGKKLIFEEILKDLASLGGTNSGLYELRALEISEGKLRLTRIRTPYDFIVRAEEFGVPQCRHRVIVIGIRSDLVAAADSAAITLPGGDSMSVGEMIGDMPALRSGLTRTRDETAAWKSTVAEGAKDLLRHHIENGNHALAREFGKIARMAETRFPATREQRELPATYGKSNHPVRRFVENDELVALAQHSTRGHMASDLSRYLFVSCFGKTVGKNPRKADWPEALAPDHQSWEKGIFSDRFRVQLSGRPSTTITSHISKDGHYFIHPDPLQCRSLTVREAARLQTFPDDYYFLGNRTQQYVQVGNAVPPYLARQIAQLLLRVLDASSGESTSSSTEPEEIFA
tara:strand:+ start:163 stop:1731 length:1569 start_codon:yes stop_codon:yes gene_type:complete